MAATQIKLPDGMYFINIYPVSVFTSLMQLVSCCALLCRYYVVCVDATHVRHHHIQCTCICVVESILCFVFYESNVQYVCVHYVHHRHMVCNFSYVVDATCIVCCVCIYVMCIVYVCVCSRHQRITGNCSCDTDEIIITFFFVVM